MKCGASPGRRLECLEDERIDSSELEALFQTQKQLLLEAFQTEAMEKVVELLTNFAAVISQRCSLAMGSIAVQSGLVELLIQIFAAAENLTLICACLDLFSVLLFCRSDVIEQSLDSVYRTINQYLNECDNEVILGKALNCVCHYVTAFPSNEFDIQFAITLDVLLTICDRFPHLSSNVLNVCSSLLMHRPFCYLVDQAVSVGLQLLERNSACDFSDFFRSLAEFVRSRSKAKSNFPCDLETPHFYELITTLMFQSSTDALMILLLSLTKHIPQARSYFLSYVDINELIHFAQTHDGRLQAVAYRLLGQYVKLRSSAIAVLFNSGITNTFQTQIEDSTYEVRCATLTLVAKLLKYGRSDPHVSAFMTPTFTSHIISFLDASTPQLDKAVLKSLIVILDTQHAIPDLPVDTLATLASDSPSLEVRILAEQILGGHFY